MRKIFAVLMLVCALGLFAQIPAGTKSVALLTGETNDLLSEGDLEFDLFVNAGYFITNGIEIDAILGIMNYGDMEFALGVGALYHMPLTPMFGLYVGAAFTYWTVGDGIMAVPIDAGLEIFLTPNNAIRVGNRFSLNLEEGMDNTDQVVIGTVHYF